MIDLSDILAALNEHLKLVLADFLVSQFGPAEDHVELDLVAFDQELARVLHLEGQVVAARVGPHPDHLDLGLFLLALSFLGLLARIIPELTVVHDTADRGFGIGCYFDEVELALLRLAPGVFNAHDPQLLATLIDHSHLPGAYPLIHPIGPWIYVFSPLGVLLQRSLDPLCQRVKDSK